MPEPTEGLVRFFPRQIDFFEIFERASRNLITASDELVGLFNHFDRIDERIEVIHALASGLDDVLDLTWAAADRVVLFHVPASRPGALALARSLKQNTETVHRAVQELRKKQYAALKKTCIDINSLENEADRLFREAIGKLFDDEKDPILLIKWKAILEHIELATDKCEDVANTLESVVLKHA